MEPTRIPAHIDDPPQILVWSADEFMPIALMLIVGILINQKLICIVVGLVLVKLYRRFRDGKPDGYPLHALYWFGLYPVKRPTVPNAFARRFYP